MSSLKLDSIAVDCPNSEALAAFYAQLLNVEQHNDAVQVGNNNLEIWFQEVEDYQPPTWPTQERGQQAHFDFAVADIDTAIERADQLGATLTERRDGYHYPILIDPAGHPFCLISENGADASEHAYLNIDCSNAKDLASFYQQLIGGSLDEFPKWVNLTREGELTLSFQDATDYQSPTWPTQERGQQIHIDFHTANRAAEVNRALELGAELKEINTSFTVMLDPAGHPFCICDAKD